MSNVWELRTALPKQNSFEQTTKFAFTSKIPKKSKPAFPFLITPDRLQHSNIPAQDGREAYQSPLLSNISLINSETFPMIGV